MFKKGEYIVLTFKEWCIKTNNYLNKIKTNKIGMEKQMLDVLHKTYDNLLLRRTTVPLFMSNPGIGKSTIVKQFAETKGVKMVKITLSTRMPNEVVGMVMPDLVNNQMVLLDSHQLTNLNDGDIVFFDEVFNGTLKQTIDAFLNLLEDRILLSGKKLADVLIVAASNHQGLINLTPQIKERFVKFELTFDKEEYQDLLKNRYGMPLFISEHLCTLIKKEKFEGSWDYVTPRSVEKAINQIGCELETPYDTLLLPFLNEKMECPRDIDSINIKKGNQVEYLNLLKLIIKQKNDTANKEQQSRITSNILN